MDQAPSFGLIPIINLILPVIAIMDIPLFFLISGALLLGKEESYSELFRKRILRFVILLVCASAVVYVLTEDGKTSLSSFLYSLIHGDIVLSYWYLYAYLAYLLTLPFLRKIAKHLTGTDVVYLILLRVIFLTVFLSLEFFWKLAGHDPIVLSSSFELPFAMISFLFFPLVGYYLANVLPLEQIQKKQIVLCIAVIIAGSAYSVAVTYIEGLTSGFTQNYLGLFNYSSPIALFLIVRYIVEKRPPSPRLCRFFAVLSSTTIGIYLLEPLISHFFLDPFFRYIPWHPVLITIASILWCLFSIAVGSVTTFFLRKIPGVKRYL